MTAFLREQGITAPPRTFNGRVPSLPVITVAEEDEQLEDDTQEQDSTSTNAIASGSGSVSIVTDAAAPGDGKKRKSITANVEAMKKKKQAEGAAHAAKNNAPKAGRYDNRAPGAIASCGECGRKFTVTKVGSTFAHDDGKDRVKLMHYLLSDLDQYTTINPLGKGGVLCSSCSTEGFVVAPKPKVKAAPKKRAVPKKEEAAEKMRILPTLQSLCITLIGKHIESIDELGDVGSINLDKICKIVCKARALNPANLSLFVDIGHSELTLYDCTSK